MYASASGNVPACTQEPKKCWNHKVREAEIQGKAHASPANPMRGSPPFPAWPTLNVALLISLGGLVGTSHGPWPTELSTGALALAVRLSGAGGATAHRSGRCYVGASSLLRKVPLERRQRVMHANRLNLVLSS